MTKSNVKKKLLELEKQRSDLAFLEQQLDLINLIEENQLDAESILGGLELGLDADVGGLLDATIAATQAMIDAANDELQIASPSKVFRRIGEQTMAGLTEGVMAMRALPGRAVAGAVHFMTQRASAPNVNTNQSNTFNTTINNQMDVAQFNAMLQRSLSAGLA